MIAGAKNPANPEVMRIGSCCARVMMDFITATDPDDK